MRVRTVVGGSAFHELGPLWQGVIVLTEVAVESRQDDPPVVLRPAFNHIWNAFGEHGSTCSMAAAKWIGRL